MARGQLPIPTSLRSPCPPQPCCIPREAPRVSPRDPRQIGCPRVPWTLPPAACALQYLKGMSPACHPQLQVAVRFATPRYWIKSRADTGSRLCEHPGQQVVETMWCSCSPEAVIFCWKLGYFLRRWKIFALNVFGGRRGRNLGHAQIQKASLHLCSAESRSCKHTLWETCQCVIGMIWDNPLD